MTALERVLMRMPDEMHRQSFLRIINESGIQDDSTDMALLALDHEARWSAVQAMTTERERIQALLQDLPSAMRVAGSEIVKGLAAEVAQQTAQATAAVVAETTAKKIEQLVENGSGSLRAHLEEHDRRVSIMHAAQSKAGTALNDAAAAATQATAQLRDMQLWTFVIAIVLCLGLAAGSAFVGYRLAYESAYPSGYAAGAAVERYSLQHHR